MSTQDKILNIRPDPPDFRDRIYNPILRPLESEINPRPFEDPAITARVRHQGKTSACTGFALAAMVEMLAHKRWQENKYQGEGPGEYSQFMLYYFARLYDEFGDDDEDAGSTARAAMKAWHKHGACKVDLWPSIEKKPSTADEPWVSDGFKTPLGAYYRVDHESIADMHAAINETGAVYVTAVVHEGWDKPDDKGKIHNIRGARIIGGHAFLIVGYDERGFWIQNSWGKEWGLNGLAHLDYTDWREHGMDAWIGQLGVYITSHLDSLGQGLQIKNALDARREMRKAEKARSGRNGIGSEIKVDTILASSRAMISANPAVRAQQINPYIVNLANNGLLSDKGSFRTSKQDLKDLANFYLDAAIKDWKLKDDDPINVALYAHGGLVPESAAGDAAATWIPALYASKIFPVFFMWETGLIDTLSNIFRDLADFDRAAGTSALGKLFGHLQDFKDDRLEGLVAPAGTPIWDEMKENAGLATTNSNGGLRLLAKEMEGLQPSILKRLRFHLIAHSAGAVFHAHLLPALLGKGIKVEGIYFMAPACRFDLFNEKIMPEYIQGKIAKYVQFHLSDPVEQADNCLHIYHRSLLYLVSNAFERLLGRPILGMEKFVNSAKLPQNNPNKAKVTMWDFITAPTNPLLNSPANNSVSTSHGGFDNDEFTIRAIIERIKRQ